MLQLIFLLFLKIEGFLGEKFTSDYLSTYLWTKKKMKEIDFSTLATRCSPDRHS